MQRGLFWWDIKRGAFLPTHTVRFLSFPTRESSPLPDYFSRIVTVWRPLGPRRRSATDIYVVLNSLQENHILPTKTHWDLTFAHSLSITPAHIRKMKEDGEQFM